MSTDAAVSDDKRRTGYGRRESDRLLGVIAERLMADEDRAKRPWWKSPWLVNLFLAPPVALALITTSCKMWAHVEAGESDRAAARAREAKVDTVLERLLYASSAHTEAIAGLHTGQESQAKATADLAKLVQRVLLEDARRGRGLSDRR